MIPHAEHPHFWRALERQQAVPKALVAEVVLDTASEEAAPCLDCGLHEAGQPVALWYTVAINKRQPVALGMSDSEVPGSVR